MMRERGTAPVTVSRRLVPLWGAVVLGLASAAWGQSAVPQAPGIKIGEGRLHPFFDLDTRYDSLIGFYSGVPGGTPLPTADVVVHFRPGLTYAQDTGSTLVNFNGAFEYLYYTGLLFKGDSALSRPQGQALLNTAFNRDGAVEVQVSDSLIRSDRTQNPAAGVGVISLFNNASLAVPIHPGGRALEITPRVAWQLELFDPLVLAQSLPNCAPTDITCTPSLVGQMNYSNLSFGLANRWKFLPKTALVLNATFDWRTYLANQTANPTAMVLNAQTGLVGLVSPHVSITALAGYGGDFAGKVNTFIANAEVNYLTGNDSRIGAGYLRTLQPVPAYGNFLDDRGYVAGRLGLIGGRLMIVGSVNFDYLTFGSNVRNDTVLSANLAPYFDVTSWFQVGLGYTGSFRTSSLSAQSTNYVRHEALLRLTVRY
jgi:hypothetical protein